MDRADLREIDHDQWVPFLAEFSKAHFGEPVEVRVVGHPNPDQAEASATVRATPLRLIADQLDAAAGERIDVVTGSARPVSHVVSHPIHVRVSDRATDGPLVVQIDGADGSTTLLRFLSDKATDA